MSPKISLDATTAKVFEAIPDGTYLAKVDKIHEPKKGPNSTYCKVEYVVKDGEHEGARLFQNAPIDGDGAGIFLDLANASLGTDYKPGDTIDDIDTDEMEGADVKLVVGSEMYQEKLQNKVRRVLPA